MLIANPSIVGFLSVLESRLSDRFVRRSVKLSPARLLGVLCLMTGFGRKGYRRVVAELRAGLGTAFGWPALALIPSPQAIGQARKSLSRDMCDQAFAAVLSGCQAASTTPVARYGGLRLLAIDGTRLNLPPSPALIAHFGLPRNHKGVCATPMAGLMHMWDVGANRPLAFSLSDCDFAERELAMELFCHVGPGDLVIADRGLPSFDLFRTLCRRRCRFLMRCSVRQNKEVMAFLTSGQNDVVVRLIKRDDQGRRCDGTPAIPIRLLRVVLPSGAIEVLATNLWLQRGHLHAAMIELYTQRWRIETAFREMKVFHALERFSATYPDGIYQEITAIHIFLVLTSEMEALARAEYLRRDSGDMNAPLTPEASGQTKETVLPIAHHIRFNRLLLADNVIQLLRAQAFGGTEAVQALLPDILSYLWKNRATVRPGRTYPRQRKRPLIGFKKRGT